MPHELKVTIKRVRVGETHSLPVDTCGFRPVQVEKDGYVIQSKYSDLVYVSDDSLVEAKKTGEVVVKNGDGYVKQESTPK